MVEYSFDIVEIVILVFIVFSLGRLFQQIKKEKG